MLKPGQRIGSWVVDDEIGAGSTAIVYRARRARNAAEVAAIKLLSVPHEEVHTRMLQEGRLAGQLRHPNIVRVLEVFDLHGTVALALEYVAGPSLRRWLQTHKGASFELRDRIARQIVEGVAHAHAAKVVHRDLKPANILLDGTPRDPVPRITDFGLAKALLEGQRLADTHTGHALGTPRYMAPEQVRSAKHVDARADVFSLGCLLFELYSGEQTFPQRDVLSVFNAVLSADHPDIGEVAPWLPASVQHVIRVALSPDPEDRPRDAGALLELLEPGDPPLAMEAPLPTPGDAPTLHVVDDLVPGIPRVPPRAPARGLLAQCVRAAMLGGTLGMGTGAGAVVILHTVRWLGA